MKTVCYHRAIAEAASYDELTTATGHSTVSRAASVEQKGDYAGSPPVALRICAWRWRRIAGKEAHACVSSENFSVLMSATFLLRGLASRLVASLHRLSRGRQESIYPAHIYLAV